MSVFIAILNDFRDFFTIRTTQGRIKILIALVVFAVFIIIVLPARTDQTTNIEETPLTTVAVRGVASFSGETQFSMLGTVSSQSEAVIRSEASGRVTSVSVSVGDMLRAGSVIATLENASEYASLLQAEGAYEAAQAAADISNVGVRAAENARESARTTALSTYKSTYATLRTTFFNDLDEIFTDPENTYRYTGIMFSNFNETEGRVNKLYKKFEKTLETRGAFAPTTENIEEGLSYAVSDTDDLLIIVQLLQSLIGDSKLKETQEATEMRYLTILSQVESNLLATKSNLENTNFALMQANETLAQAQIGGTDAELSTANAQVKQALGVLKSAQANYAKTIIRSPIAGTVNELEISIGDFVGMQDRLALVANNNALQITAYTSEHDRNQLQVGQPVRIDGSIEGIITEIAPAIDSATKKIEVKIGTDDESLTNGSTVSVAVRSSSENITTDTPTLVPIPAVKFTATNGIVFFVVDGKLKSQPVTIGAIRGSLIEITSGLEPQSVIVVDARGLVDGQSVEVIDEN